MPVGPSDANRRRRLAEQSKTGAFVVRGACRYADCRESGGGARRRALRFDGHCLGRADVAASPSAKARGFGYAPCCSPAKPARARKKIYAWRFTARARRAGEIVAINYTAIPADLLESELFGYVRGAGIPPRRKPSEGSSRSPRGAHCYLDKESEETSAGAAASEVAPLSSRQAAAAPRAPPSAAKSTCASSPLRIAPSHAARCTPFADLMARLGPEAIALPPLRARREDASAPLAHSFLGFIGGPGWRLHPAGVPLPLPLPLATEHSQARERDSIGDDVGRRTCGRRRAPSGVGDSIC